MSVYFAQVGPHIKIGYSTNPERRVARMFSSTTRYSAPTGTPTGRAHRHLIRAIDGDLGTERLIHLALDDFRIGEEWFVDEPEVQRFIATAKTAKRYAKVRRPAGPVCDERDDWSEMSPDERKQLMGAINSIFAPLPLPH